MAANIDKPSWIRIWVTAARPHTLTASISPCIVTYACVRPPARLMGLWLFYCLTIQIGTNLHNDYADFVQGADTDKRVGQPRATARGWLTPRQTCIAATTVLLCTFVTGVVFGAVTDQLSNLLFWLLIGISIFNAFAYTGGPYPLGYIGLGNWSIGYSGLGDLFVFLFFGLGASWMIPLTMIWQGEPFDGLSVLVSGVQVGLLATNIIVVNNLRDRLTDVLVGKRTLAVRFGRRFSEMEYIVCNIGAFLLVLVDWFWSRQLRRLLPLLVVPLALKETKAVLSKEGAQLNRHVGGAAIVELLFCLLFLVGRSLSDHA